MPNRVLPPLRRTAADAKAYARVVHAGQVDKAGRPYVEHLGRVSVIAMSLWMNLGMGAEDADLDLLCQIAWLHDVIEDTDHNEDDLHREGFDQGVVSGVSWLTKCASAPYAAWIERLCTIAPLPALIVKLADMEDNSDPARLALLPAETRARLERKYGPAIEMVRAAVERVSS